MEISDRIFEIFFSHEINIVGSIFHTGDFRQKRKKVLTNIITTAITLNIKCEGYKCYIYAHRKFFFFFKFI